MYDKELVTKDIKRWLIIGLNNKGYNATTRSVTVKKSSESVTNKHVTGNDLDYQEIQIRIDKYLYWVMFSRRVDPLGKIVYYINITNPDSGNSIQFGSEKGYPIGTLVSGIVRGICAGCRARFIVR